MESTYIIVLEANQFAFIRILRFEPYISLLVACNLYDNYDLVSAQILTGSNRGFGTSIRQTQLEFSKEDYANWIADHDYLYKQVAISFGTTFLYKRKLMPENTIRIQPIINELSLFSPLSDENTNISRLTTSLTGATDCDDIFNCAGLLVNTFPKLESETAIRNINELVKTTFLKLDKNQLDQTEPLLLKWRETALQSLPIALANEIYRDLKNGALNLCAKRDAFLGGYGPEGDVRESASQLASLYDTDLAALYKQGCYFAYIGLQLEISLLFVKQLYTSLIEDIPTLRPAEKVANYANVNWIVNQCKHRITNTVYDNTRDKLFQMEAFFTYVNSLSDKQLALIDAQLSIKYKHTYCYIDVDSCATDDMFVKEHNLYTDYKQVAYQLRRREIESLLLSPSLPLVQEGVYQFTIFYTFDYHVYSDDNAYMLMASIYSCIREFGSNAQILVYTTNSNQLTYLFLKYPELNKRVFIRDYFPVNTRENGFSGSNAHFSTIGHARVFLVKGLLLETEKPVVYLDNDTGIQLGHGDKCMKLLFGLETPMGFAEEMFCKFGDIIPDLDAELNIHPLNNGILLYPYNDFALAFAERNIEIYNELSMNSIYTDMLSFTMTCHEKGCFATIYNGVETPCFIHYYINKHTVNIHDFNCAFYLIFYSGENFKELQL